MKTILQTVQEYFPVVTYEKLLELGYSEEEIKQLLGEEDETPEKGE